MTFLHFKSLALCHHLWLTVSVLVNFYPIFQHKNQTKFTKTCNVIWLLLVLARSLSRVGLSLVIKVNVCHSLKEGKTTLVWPHLIYLWSTVMHSQQNMYRKVASRSTCYYSGNQKFCILNSRFLTCRTFCLGTKLFCLSR